MEKQVLIMFYKGKNNKIPKNHIATSHQILADMFYECDPKGFNTINAIIPSSFIFGKDYDFFKDNPFILNENYWKQNKYNIFATMDINNDTVSNRFGCYMVKVKEKKLDSYIDKIILLSIANEKDTKKYIDIICSNENIPKEKIVAYLI